MIKSILLSIAMLIGFNTSVYANTSDPVGTTTIYGGTYNDVEVVGNYAYVATTPGLKILDISNPSAPSLIGSYTTSGTADEISVEGNYVYIADGSTEGFKIIDVTDKSNPTLVSSYVGARDIKGINVIGNYVYFLGYLGTAFDYSLVILDVTNKAIPVQSGSHIVDASPYGSAFSISGDFAYVVSRSGGLQVLDILDKNNPVIGPILAEYYGNRITVSGDYAYITQDLTILIVNVANIATTIPELIGSYTTNALSIYSNRLNVRVDGNYAYLIDNYGFERSLIIVDITDKSDPVSVGNVVISSSSLAENMNINGNYAYIAAGIDGLQTVDILDKLNPSLTSTYGKGTWVNAVNVDGNYAYLATFGSGLEILDISDKSNPQLIGNYDSLYYVNTLKVDGNYVYVTSRNRLIILDISDKSNTTYVGEYTSLAQSSSFRQFTIDGNYVYLMDYVGWEQVIQILDISDKTNPITLGSYTPSATYSNEMIIDGSYMYINNANGIEIISLIDKNNPELVGSYTPTGLNTYSNASIKLEADYMYLLNDNGVEIVDITDKSTPTLLVNHLAGIALNYFTKKVIIDGNYAYLLLDAGDQGTFSIVDISDKNLPVRKGNYDTTGYGSNVKIAGNNVYIVGDKGLILLDITDKNNPVSIASYSTSGRGRDLNIVDNYVYVSDDKGGLVMIKVSDGDNSHLPSINNINISPIVSYLLF